MDPFGYYAEGIQQRLDDAFVEGETSSQGGHADQGTPSAEETPSFVPPPTTAAANAAGNSSTAPPPEEPNAPSTQEEAQVASPDITAAVKFQALHLTAVVIRTLIKCTTLQRLFLLKSGFNMYLGRMLHPSCKLL